MKKRPVNPPIIEGDRIELYYMEGETSVAPGTEGTVVSIDDDPFDRETKLIRVKWDNGSQLSLCTDVDKWKMARQENIDEQVDGEGSTREYDFFGKNEEIFDLFDWRFLNKYLKVIQKTGIVNMLGSSPILYCGSEHLDRYYGEGKEDNENFQEALEMADTAKDKMVQGTVKWLEENDKEVTVENANRYISKLAVKIVQLYATFY
jgi:hypothetical protein